MAALFEALIKEGGATAEMDGEFLKMNAPWEKLRIALET